MRRGPFIFLALVAALIFGGASEARGFTKNQPGPASSHVYAGGQLVCSFETNSTLFGGSDTNRVAYYYHEDNLNSSTALSSGGTSGTQIEVDAYYPFGRLMTASPQASFKVSRQFTGQIKDDDTGLCFYNTRYYDPLLDRFIQADTTIPDLGNPQSYNRYSYCLNNPLKYTDPSGRWAQEVADWWGSTVNTGAGYISAGPSHWIWNGTVGTASSLIGGVAAPLTLGTSSGSVSGNPNATAKDYAVATVTETANLAAVVPVTAASGKALSTLLRAGEKDAAGELAGSLSGCFVAGTLVAAENGYIEIQDVKEGDLVWSYSLKAQEWQLRPVESRPIHDYTGDVITIDVGGTIIETTGNHPFWVVSGEALAVRPAAQDVSEGERAFTTFGRWIEARRLAVDDKLLLVNGETARVKSLSVHQDHLLVYNLHVADNHTYAVSQDGILVHNKAAQIKPVPTDAPAPTIDPVTGQPVQRFIVDKNGNVMIEPVGGTTKPWGKGGADTHTTYSNGSPYQRLDRSHGQETHGHGHLPGTGPGKAGTGPSLDTSGNVVPNNSAGAHWPVKKDKN
jgi:RHS repeat-associated protein